MPDQAGRTRVIRVVDFETTGGEPPDAGIIEVGWCDLLDTGGGWEVTLPTALLVRPDRPIDVEARAVHHIRDVDLEDAQDAAAVLAFVAAPAHPSEDIVAFAAHATGTEAALWPGAPAPWICTYKAALHLWPDVLRYWLGLDLAPQLALPAHRAGPDAFVTAHILLRQLRGGMSLEDAIAWQKVPALLATIPFGKNRGAKWSEIETGFLNWILERDFGEDVLYTARHELERRYAAGSAERARQASLLPALTEDRGNG